MGEEARTTESLRGESSEEASSAPVRIDTTEEEKRRRLRLLVLAAAAAAAAASALPAAMASRIISSLVRERAGVVPPPLLLPRELLPPVPAGLQREEEQRARRSGVCCSARDKLSSQRRGAGVLAAQKPLGRPHAPEGDSLLLVEHSPGAARREQQRERGALADTLGGDRELAAEPPCKAPRDGEPEACRKWWCGVSSQAVSFQSGAGVSPPPPRTDAVLLGPHRSPGTSCCSSGQPGGTLRR